MKNKINLSIPQPCHENWEAMTSMEKGRFCGSCQKNVFDFTTASDSQIIRAYNENENLCGRFITSQLNRDLIAPKEKSSIWLATSSAIISFLSLGSHEVMAQGTVKTEQTDKKTIPEKSDTTTSNQDREITGIVSDITGPLPGANVVIKGTTRGAQTDIDGKFSIKAKENDILIISFVGMETKELSISKSVNYEIKMIEDNNQMLGEIITIAGGISRRNYEEIKIPCTDETYKKRTFFGRLFHKIGNAFR